MKSVHCMYSFHTWIMLCVVSVRWCCLTCCPQPCTRAAATAPVPCATILAAFTFFIPVGPVCAHPVLLLRIRCVCSHRQLPQQKRLWLPRPRKKRLQSRRMCLLSSSQRPLKLTGCLRRLKRRLPPRIPRNSREDAKQVARIYFLHITTLVPIRLSELQEILRTVKALCLR